MSMRAKPHLVVRKGQLRHLALMILLAGCGRSVEDERVLSFSEFREREANRSERPVNDAPCGQSCQELRQEFRYTAYVGKEIYCYWDLKKAETGTDFDALALDLEGRISDTTDFPAYFLLLSEWAAAFHDGHVNVYPPESMNQLNFFSAPLSLSVLAAGTDHEQVVVVAASPQSGALAGDEVLTINGTSAKVALDRLERLRSGSTARMRRSRPSLLVNAIGTQSGTEDLRVQVSRNGSDVILDLTRQADLGSSTASPPLLAFDAVKVSILPGKIGYLRLDSMYTPDDLEAAVTAALDRLAFVRGLIVDVRRNGGGDFPAGDLVMARLISAPVTRLERAKRLAPFIFNDRPEDFLADTDDATPGYSTWVPHTVEPDANTTLRGKPVVLLTGPRCFSACDTFVAGMATNGLATVMGEGTGGGTGSPLEVALPISGLTFRYSVVRGRTIHGDWIEGKGTEPQFIVEPDLSTVLGQSDNQIDAAHQHLLAGLGDHGDAPVAPAVLAAAGSVYAVPRVGTQLQVELLEERRQRLSDEYHR